MFFPKILKSGFLIVLLPAEYRYAIRSRRDKTSFLDPHLFGSPGPGTVFFRLSWIRIRIYLDLMDPDLDAIKFTKMCTFQFYIGFSSPTFQIFFFTYIGMH